MSTTLVPIADMERMALAALPRLLEKVQPLPWSGCWIWMGSCGNSGYGKIRVWGGKEMTTHRISYLAHRGDTRGLFVLHKCDVRSCVNPDHLFLGTQSDNIKDAVRKGTHYSYTRLRTHCPQGHEYSGINSQGRRICAICIRTRRAKCLPH